MLSPVYAPYTLVVERAEGVRLFTDKGVFLDTYAGIGVLPLGHSHPDVVRAIREKSERYTHLSNYFLDPDAPALAESLLFMTGRKGEVYFANSGAEAMEAALKAVKKNREGALVSFEGNFHGRTLGALSVTWGPAIRHPFDPLIPHCAFLPFNGEALLRFARENEIAAVFLECIQGNSGVYPLPADLAEAVNILQKERGILVVADEIQAGLGRTGRYFAYEHFGLRPDIITLGKGIGGGLPLGAAIFCEWSPFASGEHGSTFAPNPVSLAAGKATLAHITPSLLGDVSRKGERLRERLALLSWARGTRGLGLMIGVSAENPAEVKKKAFERGVLLNVTGGGIRFLPALTMSDAEIEEILSLLNF
ncbi:MAG TPA: aminotransferase class III-fold pyridoxal phosphate-dependent enzyme [Synergistales bacterium]|jgi:acetylornithine/succinyldiaminopimelate/putrescine aminotransferase|nr:aminotransferase class III-fold pyridoxal phosphate-dependent enzyme [Synergistaceae bacterium]HPE64892.1 aminotransferase class III-fold pyridoxal phosphate-dependent enzyme [Synergistales bacterium]